MNVPHFEREFTRFRDTIYPRFGDGPFTGFHDGAARSWEAYKPRLRAVALERLGVAGWTEADIGSGRPLEALISAIEIPGNDQSRNNLLPWEGRYGPGSAGHAALLAARQQPAVRRGVDLWLWDAFRRGAEPADLFERFRALAGDGYPLAAYVFFLLDIDRFAPIAPRTFDRAFERLGIDLAMSGRCSWANFSAYNEALDAVRRELARRPGLSDARHIDAHSFCWMLVRMEDARPGQGDAPGIVRHASAMRRAIYTMADNAAKAAAASNRQSLHTSKNKEVHHAREELVGIIEALIREQQGRCALTDLPLQWRGDHDDPELCASLDRIDSDSHYEMSNLQVVCWFANRWKGSTANGEFRRLLAMLRQ